MSDYNEHEREAIILNAICHLIDEMNNHEMFTISEGSNISFKTSAHKKLFNILLVDFLSKVHERKNKLPFNLSKPSEHSVALQNSYLFYLDEIIRTPNLGRFSEELKAACDHFVGWLEGYFVIKDAWFPSIDLGDTMKVRRFDALKLTGNIAKHNFTRLERGVIKIQSILKDNGHERTIEDCYLIIPEFQEWFHDHAFVALSTSIAKSLNDIRWAIHNYLIEEFERSYTIKPHTQKNFELYEYDYPKHITKPFARAAYWDLMNLIRGKPYLPKFTIASFADTLLS